MSELRRFRSRRNDVRLITGGQEPIVEKIFTDRARAELEVSVYELLRGRALRAPRLIDVKADRIYLSYLQGTVFVTLLEQQEKTGVDMTPWHLLIDWLLSFYRLTGLIMTDVNLRNFLYLPDERTVAGLDFEECAPGQPADMLACLCAFILLYNPPFTAEKNSIVREIGRCAAEKGICCTDVLTEKSAREIGRLQSRREKAARQDETRRAEASS